MNEASVRKWYIMFNKGQKNVHGDERSGWPSLITDELMKKADDNIHEDRHFNLDTLHSFSL